MCSAMAIIRRTKTDDYVVIHHVQGEQGVIDFLRMTSRVIVSRLFNEARTQGRAIFAYRNLPYELTWTKNDLYLIEEQEIDDSQNMG